MRHNNTDIPQQINDVFKIKGESLPSTISDDIVLVHNVNQKIETLLEATATNATSATVYTTPADKDFFVSAVLLTLIKDATATSTFSSIVVRIGGIPRAIAKIQSLTLTAQNQSLFIQLPSPVKVDRSNTITVTNTTNVGNVSATAIVYGYHVN